MAITINGSGTITGVSAGGLPDGSITADDLASTLDISGKTVTLPSDVGGITTGKVLQVVSATKTDTFSTTSSSYTDVTGLSVSITPSSTSSKVVVFISMNLGLDDYRQGSGYRIVRDSTALCIGDSAGSRAQVTGGWEDMPSPNYTMFSASMNYLDSPSTTSATTYKIQVAQTQSFGTLYVNRTGVDSDSSAYPRGASTITVMEIAG